MTEIPAPKIPGADNLVQWFGKWPSFHDAEILEITLRREGTSLLRLHTWSTATEIDARGCFLTKHDAVVTVRFDEVLDLELTDFSAQNVISGLGFEPSDSGWRVTLGPSFGVSGFIEAAHIEISLDPGKP